MGEMEHGLYRQVVFIFEISLFCLLNKGFLKCGLWLQGGLCSEVVFNTGLTAYFLTEKKFQSFLVNLLHGYKLLYIYSQKTSFICVCIMEVC